jgi:hypothetical protein
MATMTEADAKNAVDTIATLSQAPDALSASGIKNLIGVLEKLQTSNKASSSSLAVMNSFGNLLETVNDYPNELTEAERKALAKKAIDGFSKALENDLKNNKNNLLNGNVEYKTSNVAVTAILKDLTATNPQRLLQSANTAVTISDAALKQAAGEQQVVIQIEEWVDNPKNSMSSQQISTNVFTITLRKFSTFEIIDVKGLTDPIKINLKRKFGTSNANDTCFFWSDEKANWETTGVELESSSDTTILCKTNHLTAFGAGTSKI